MNTLAPIPGIETLSAAPLAPLLLKTALVVGAAAVVVLGVRAGMQKLGLLSKA